MKLSVAMRIALENAKILRFDRKRNLYLAWYGSDYLCAFDFSGKTLYKVAGFNPSYPPLGEHASIEQETLYHQQRREETERMSLRVLRTMELFLFAGRPACQENACGEWELVKRITP